VTLTFITTSERHVTTYILSVKADGREHFITRLLFNYVYHRNRLIHPFNISCGTSTVVLDF